MEWISAASSAVQSPDIGDEAVDAGVDAGGLLAVQVAARGREVRQHLQIREAAPVGGVGSVAPNPLEMVALEIELLRLAQPRFRQARVLPEQRILEQRPEPLVLP